MKKSYVAVGAALAAFTFAAPTAAMAVHMSTYGSRTDEYESWGGIRVSDINADSNDVYADWKRDVGTPQVLRNSRGNGTSEESGTSSNKVARFNSCTDDAGPNTCSGTVYR